MIHKYCITSFLILCLVNISISLQPGPIPLSVRHIDLIQSQSCERGGWLCKDCYTLQSCDTDNNFRFQITCGSQFPGRPYCNPKIGRCESDRYVCSEMKDPEFKCPNVGIFPDLTNCRRYVSCTAKGEIGLIYSCLFQSTYNPIVKRCITDSKCYNAIIDCNEEYKTMAYIPDPSLYVVCRGKQKPLIKDCGSKMLEYDPNLLTCDFKCKEEGSFAHSTNNSLYYICVYDNNELIRMMGKCREGTIYNEIYSTCVYDFNLTTTTRMIEVTTEHFTQSETGSEEQTSESNDETTINNGQDFNSTTISEKTTTKNNDGVTTTKNKVTTENIFSDATSNAEVTTKSNYEDVTPSDRTNYETTTEVRNLTTGGDLETHSKTTIISEKITFPFTNLEETTTKYLMTEDVITTNADLEKSTTFTTDNNNGEFVTTDSSEKDLDTEEVDNTYEDSKEIGDDNEETDTEQETDDTEEDDINESIEETENNTNEEEKENISNEEIEEYSTDKDDTKEESNESKNKNNNCDGKKCKENWKHRLTKLFKFKD